MIIFLICGRWDRLDIGSITDMNRMSSPFITALKDWVSLTGDLDFFVLFLVTPFCSIYSNIIIFVLFIVTLFSCLQMTWPAILETLDQVKFKFFFAIIRCRNFNNFFSLLILPLSLSLSLSATIFNDARQQINVYGDDIEVDYRGYEVSRAPCHEMQSSFLLGDSRKFCSSPNGQIR